jgi:hypothetical protein
MRRIFQIRRNEMKSNRLTNILLVAVLAVLVSGRLPAASPTPVQPAAAAPAAPSAYIPQAPIISGYVSVSAAAFHPQYSDKVYINSGYNIEPLSSTSVAYIAGISLPDGATIDSLDCAMWELGIPISNGMCTLWVANLSGPMIGYASFMGTASTNHSTNAWGLYSTTSIYENKVDNSQRAYYIYLYLP